MKSKPFLIGALSLLSLGGIAFNATAAVVGGLDPAIAPGAFTSDTAGNFMVIANQFTYTTTGAEMISLSASIFGYQSNGNTGAGATPFLAIQTGAANSHLVSDYDVIWTGSNLTNAGSGVDVSAPLGAGNFLLPAGSTIVGGYFASGGGAQLSPASAVFAAGTPNDVLIIAQATVSVAGDIAVTGTNWSTNPAVSNRVYHYQIDLQPVPEPSVSLLFGVAGVVALLRRRR